MFVNVFVYLYIRMGLYPCRSVGVWFQILNLWQQNNLFFFIAENFILEFMLKDFFPLFYKNQVDDMFACYRVELEL